MTDPCAEAIHESGHAIMAITLRIRVTSIEAWITHSSLDAYEMPLGSVHAYKVAGAVAVEMWNEKHGTAHELGFGKVGGEGSDAWLEAKILKFVEDFGAGPEAVEFARTSIRTFVRSALNTNWAAVEKLASALDAAVKSGRGLSESEIKAAIVA
jgi:hypothetical protein